MHWTIINNLWETIYGTVYMIPLYLMTLPRVKISSDDSSQRNQSTLDINPQRNQSTTYRNPTQVRSGMGGIRRSSASPRPPPCDGIPSPSVWPSPRQTPCPYPSDALHLTQPWSVWTPPSRSIPTQPFHSQPSRFTFFPGVHVDTGRQSLS